jgi:hypothetical protein
MSNSATLERGQLDGRFQEGKASSQEQRASVQFLQFILLSLIAATMFTGIVMGGLIARAVASDGVQFAGYQQQTFAWETVR